MKNFKKLLNLTILTVCLISGKTFANASYNVPPTFSITTKAQEAPSDEDIIIKQIIPNSEWIQPTLDRAEQKQYGKEALEKLQMSNRAISESIEKFGTKIEKEIKIENRKQMLKVQLLFFPPKYKAPNYDIEQLQNTLMYNIDIAIRMLYDERCLVRTDNIRITIDEPTNPVDKAAYLPWENLFLINSSQINDADFAGTIAHELMHKFSYEKLGYLPNWLDEGLATQFNEPTAFGSFQQPLEAVHKNYLERNFSYINDYPSDYNMQLDFYSFNQKFIGDWIAKNEICFGKLVKKLQPLVKGKTQEVANIILRNYFIENGGQEILEKWGFAIPEAWKKKSTTAQQNTENINKKNSQEKKPKKASSKSGGSTLL